ncbi:MAG: hypothetical protein AAFZ18_11755 [Myxococcota bacterium]
MTKPFPFLKPEIVYPLAVVVASLTAYGSDSTPTDDVDAGIDAPAADASAAGPERFYGVAP